MVNHESGLHMCSVDMYYIAVYIMHGLTVDYNKDYLKGT